MRPIQSTFVDHPIFGPKKYFFFAVYVEIIRASEHQDAFVTMWQGISKEKLQCYSWGVTSKMTNFQIPTLLDTLHSHPEIVKVSKTWWGMKRHCTLCVKRQKRFFEKFSWNWFIPIYISQNVREISRNLFQRQNVWRHKWRIFKLQLL